MMRFDGNGRPVALALQGGGAHGAYGWGVLDRLLEAGLPIGAVSGASAGALNGAALVAGLAAGGHDGARAALERLWRGVSDRSPLRTLDWADWAAPWFQPWVDAGLDAAKLASRYVAPFTPGIADMGALRAVVADAIDLERLADPAAVPLHVSATRVANGAARIFTRGEVTLDALMASACLPDLFGAVEIDGEPYWDGGFSANPPLEPLVLDDGVGDVVIVQITPFAAEPPGRAPAATVRRVSDISFNAALLRDITALVTMADIARAAASDEPRLALLARMRLHLIEPPAALAGTSKIDTRWSMIERSRDLGRAHAGAWLARDGDDIGTASTLTELPASLAE